MFEIDEKLTKKMYFFAILSIFDWICILSFSSNVSFIQVVRVNNIVAVDLTVSSFMSTNNVRKTTKKIYFFASLSILGWICILSFSSNVSLTHNHWGNRVVTVNFTVSSFMSANDVQKLTCKTHEKMYFQYFWRDIYLLVFNK